MSDRSPSLIADFLELTKARLNLMVVLTTAFGFLLFSPLQLQGWLLVHTLFGCLLCALASGAINQLMEAKYDRAMRRTQNRPVVQQRISEPMALLIGWLLAAWGIVHLGTTVQPDNPQAAWIAMATLGIYLFVYTPLKRVSGSNTLVGAVAGALPPLLGWMGAGGSYSAGAWFVFLLQFCWQMPHFMAINWLYREDYETAGYVMWAHGDESGRRSALISLVSVLVLLALVWLPYVSGLCGLLATLVAFVLTLCWSGLNLLWYLRPSRVRARQVFFSSLIYLPLVYLIYLLGFAHLGKG